MFTYHEALDQLFNNLVKYLPDETDDEGDDE